MSKEHSLVNWVWGGDNRGAVKEKLICRRYISTELHWTYIYVQLYIHHTCVLFRGGHCAVCCVLWKIHSCFCLAVVVQRTFPSCPKYGYVLSSVQFVCTWCASGKVAPNGRKFCGKKMWQPEGDGPHIRITRIKAKNQECKNELRKCNSWSEINIPSEMQVSPSYKLLVHCLQRLHCYTDYLLFAV